MNPFNLPLQRLQLPAPLPVRLTAETLSAWQIGDNLMAWVRRRAAQRLLRVRQRRLTVRQATRHYVQQMRKRGQAQVTQLFERTQQQAIRETIQWLVATQQIEQALADQLVQQAAQWAVAAFKQLVASADQTQLLWQQLQGAIHELQDQGQLTLRVHPSQQAALQNRLFHQRDVRVIAEQQLQPLQASLESSLVKIELDLHRHLNLLVEQLLGQEPHAPVSEVCAIPQSETAALPPELPSAKVADAAHLEEVHE